MGQKRQYIFQASLSQKRRYVSIWLSILALLIVSIVLLGGYTRLTGSGLSIVQWAPLAGIVPPLDQADWEREFDQYKMLDRKSGV
jgi:cytochrome c oxidase assembly protein subunit 15